MGLYLYVEPSSKYYILDFSLLHHILHSSIGQRFAMEYGVEGYLMFVTMASFLPVSMTVPMVSIPRVAPALQKYHGGGHES